jgi:hypothetical protein
MSIVTVGPWILLGVGTVILLGAVWAVFKGKQAKSLWMMWIVGFATSGVAIYGPAFLGQYGEFVKVLMQLQSNPTPETYSKALDDVASGKFPAAYDSVIVQFALSQPVEGMDSLLQHSLERATDKQGKEILTDAAATWSAKKEVAKEISRHLAGTTDIEIKLASFDPVTRSLVARALLKESADASSTPKFDKEKVKKFSPFSTKVAK